jgi:chromosome segregation ATPase
VCAKCKLGWWDQWNKNGSKKGSWAQGPPDWLGAQKPGKDAGQGKKEESGGAGAGVADKVAALERLLGQLGWLEQADPILHESLQIQVKEQLSQARAEQPYEEKLSRLRSLSDKADHRRRQVEQQLSQVDKLQSQLDVARDRLRGLETELRDITRERAELLEELRSSGVDPDADMEEETDRDLKEAIAEEARAMAAAQEAWKQASQRVGLLRARPKASVGRRGPYDAGGSEISDSQRSAGVPISTPSA